MCYGIIDSNSTLPTVQSPLSVGAIAGIVIAIAITTAVSVIVSLIVIVGTVFAVKRNSYAPKNSTGSEEHSADNNNIRPVSLELSSERVNDNGLDSATSTTTLETPLGSGRLSQHSSRQQLITPTS